MITFAVVPILVQAGTSVLPAIFGSTGALLVLLFRPLQQLRRSRWKWCVVALCVLAVVIVASGGKRAAFWAKRVLSPNRTDWAQVAVNTIRSEQLADAGQFPTTAGPIHLRSSWEFKLPGASFLATPAVRNARVYGASCSVDVNGTLGSVFCLDAATGRPIWQVEKVDNQALKGIFSSPALTADGKYVVIGEGLHFDRACHLICLDARTGELHWKIDVPQNHVESSPCIQNDLAVAGAGAIERANHLPADSPGYVLAVRISDGKPLWSHQVTDPESSPVIALDGTVYIGSGVDGRAIVAIGPNGRRLWTASTAYPATGSISLVDDLVIAGTGRGDFVNADRHPAGAVIAVNVHTGNIQWQEELPDAVLGQVAIGDGNAFCPVRNGTVVALDLQDGRRLWSQKIAEAPVLAGPALSGDYLYAVSSDGFLEILEKKTGRVIEKHNLNDEANPGRQNLCVSAPIVSAGRIFVGSETGGLRCFVGTAN